MNFTGKEQGANEDICRPLPEDSNQSEADAVRPREARRWPTRCAGVRRAPPIRSSTPCRRVLPQAIEMLAVLGLRLRRGESFVRIYETLSVRRIYLNAPKRTPHRRSRKLV